MTSGSTRAARGSGGEGGGGALEFRVFQRREEEMAARCWRAFACIVFGVGIRAVRTNRDEIKLCQRSAAQMQCLLYP